MKITFLNILMLLILGMLIADCHKPHSDLIVFNVAASRPLTDAEKIALLDKEAKSKHLKFRVYCTRMTNGDPRWNFQAEAQRATTKWNAQYIEDGATPWWAGHGDTQADAALHLYEQLRRGDAPIQPDHDPALSGGRDKICPLEIFGGENPQ